MTLKNIKYLICTLLIQIGSYTYSMDSSSHSHNESYKSIWSNEFLARKFTQTPTFQGFAKEAKLLKEKKLSLYETISLYSLPAHRKIKMMSQWLHDITMPEPEDALKAIIEATVKKVNKQEQITESDFEEFVSSWNKLKSLYDYNWFDRIFYPLRPFISWNSEDINPLEKFKKIVLLRIHPDKCPSTTASEASKVIADMTKPSLPLDGLVMSVIGIPIDLLTMFSFRLINKISPDFFKQRKEIIELKELKGRIALKKEEVQIKKSILALKRQEMKIMNIISKMN